MSETTIDTDSELAESAADEATTADAATPGDAADGTEAPSDYTTSTVQVAPRRDVVTRPAAALGRRKEAIARVRLVPGTGQWTINGRALEQIDLDTEEM